MKKLRIAALLLVLVLLLGTAAVAAEPEVLKNTKGTVSFTPVNVTEEAYTTETTVAFGTVTDENGNTVTSEEKITVTVKSAALKKGEEVLILMCKYKTDGTPDIADGNIYYIDQQTLTADGSVTFDVYPSYMKDSIIYISGVADGLLKAVIVDGLVYGDVNGDGTVNVFDIIFIANIILKRTETDASANVNNDSTINVFDIIAVANVILKRT